MPEIQEEEIDLREYINVLLKRKGIIRIWTLFSNQLIVELIFQRKEFI